MKKNYWMSYELKSLGLNHKTIKAIQRIQRKEIYSNKKQEELKLFAAQLIHSIKTENRFRNFF